MKSFRGIIMVGPADWEAVERLGARGRQASDKPLSAAPIMHGVDSLNAPDRLTLGASFQAHDGQREAKGGGVAGHRCAKS
jgi:hypothetical protein